MSKVALKYKRIDLAIVYVSTYFQIYYLKYYSAKGLQQIYFKTMVTYISSVIRKSSVLMHYKIIWGLGAFEKLMSGERLLER